MTPIRIDFAAPGLRPALMRLRWTQLAGAALGGLLLLSAAVAGYRMLSDERAYAAEVHRVDALQARLARQASQVMPAPTQAQVSTAQAAAVNGAILRLNLPWRELQDAVGRATPPTVALLALEPDAAKRRLRITAQSRSSDAMLNYLHALKQQTMFSAVLLTRHEIHDQEPGAPLHFQLEAQWVQQ